ncbi:endonuclease/exonuclease/phosphatase family protein [Streptomyces sp. ODS28]|uniref:endonuclease/exonuclease/phosphatase family protein n=1 Tax=Streptomyces sp. ODS28 TaxID=3136688 RepID=UPI0031ED753F
MNGTDDTITVAQWNVEHDGGHDGQRWEAAHELLRSYAPDIVLRQEMTHSHAQGRKRLYDAERALGLRGFLAPATPESPNACGVFLNTDVFEPLHEYRHETLRWHPPCNLVVRFACHPVPLSLTSFHLCSFDPDTRLTEAQWLTTLAKPGMVSLIAGDANSYPHAPERIRLPDWDAVEDRSHIAHRTIPDPSGRYSDTRPDAILTTAGFQDLARYAADHLNQRYALTATAGYRRPDQGGPQRIDRAYASGGLAAALTGVEVIDTEEVRAASDHALLIYRFHRGRMERLLQQPPVLAAAR